MLSYCLELHAHALLTAGKTRLEGKQEDCSGRKEVYLESTSGCLVLQFINIP